MKIIKKILKSKKTLFKKKKINLKELFKIPKRQ